jgi:branched-chain amino acid transport system permease protein
MRWPLLLLALLVLGILPLFLPWLGFVFTLALAKGLAALGIALLLRAGLVSFGHGLFFGAGAYAVAFALREPGRGSQEATLLLLLALVVGLVLGFLVGLFVSRYRGIFFAMLNLAFSMVFFALLAKFYHWTGGTDGLRVPTPTVMGLVLERNVFGEVLFYASLALVIGLSLLLHTFLETPVGKALGAIRTNEVRLEYLGIPVQRVILLTYLLSAGLAGLGGGLTALAVGHVVPELAYWVASGEFVYIAILGGIGAVPGPLLGALVYELIRTFAFKYLAYSWQLLLGTTMLLVIFFAPGGIWMLLGERRQRVAPK